MFTILQIIQPAILLLLIVLAFFFSFAETSFISVNIGRLCRLKSMGNKKALVALNILNNKEGLLRTVLLGNTATSIFSASLTTHIVYEKYGDNVLIYFSIALTVVILLIGEILPKTYASRNPEKVALSIAPLTMFFIKLLFPFTYFIDKIAVIMQKILGLDRDIEISNIADDVKGLVAMYTNEDDRHYDLKMLSSIADLESIEISQIMTHRSSVFMIDIDNNIEVIIDNIVNSTFSRIPVCKGNSDDVIGILYIKKLCKIALKNNELTKDDIIASCFEPWYIPDTISLRDQLLEFRKRKVHFAVVINEYSTFQGIITLEDIIEQIVGSIYDEHDIEKKMFVKISDNEYVVDGACSIRDLNKELNMSLPCDEAATLGGLVLYVAEKLPNIGESFTFSDIVIKILAIKNKKISLVQITRYSN